jgi:16S rRNA U1498 N3-methylase RsmE
MQLFYNLDLKQGAITFFFDKEESKHIIKVLRKKEGDKIFITNGLGFLFESEIVLASEKKCEIKIVKENIHLKRKEIIKLLPNRSLASLKHAITNLQKSKT